MCEDRIQKVFVCRRASGGVLIHTLEGNCGGFLVMTTAVLPWLHLLQTSLALFGCLQFKHIQRQNGEDGEEVDAEEKGDEGETTAVACAVTAMFNKCCRWRSVNKSIRRAADSSDDESAVKTLL